MTTSISRPTAAKNILREISKTSEEQIRRSLLGSNFSSSFRTLSLSMNRIFGKAKEVAPPPSLNDATGRIDSSVARLDEKIAKLEGDLRRMKDQMKKAKGSALVRYNALSMSITPLHEHSFGKLSVPHQMYLYLVGE